VRTALDSVIDGYMKELQAELRGFPAARRREILEEVREHISQARSELDSENEAAIRTVLDRLGEPSDIAAEARQRLGVRPARAGALEVLTLIGLVVPFFGWVVGVPLLWASRVWAMRDKIIGTILVPGVWTFVILYVTPVSHTSVRVKARGRPGETPVFIGPDGSEIATAPDWVGPLTFALAVIVPIATTVYLAIRMRNLSDAAAAA
jgi:hypothetical protein